MILIIKILVILVILVFLYFCQKSLVQAFAFYLAVKMVLPTTTRIGGISIYAFMLLCLLFFVLVKKGNKQCDFSRKNLKIALFPLLTLVVPLFFIGLFGEVDYAFQYKQLFQFALTEIIPYCLFIIIVTSEAKLQLCIKTLLISFI